jgi:hypothetical protein
MFVDYFWQQCVIRIRDALRHLAGLLCIKFHEDILIINVALPLNGMLVHHGLAPKLITLLVSLHPEVGVYLIYPWVEKNK